MVSVGCVFRTACLARLRCGTGHRPTPVTALLSPAHRSLPRSAYTLTHRLTLGSFPARQRFYTISSCILYLHVVLIITVERIMAAQDSNKLQAELEQLQQEQQKIADEVRQLKKSGASKEKITEAVARLNAAKEAVQKKVPDCQHC